MSEHEPSWDLFGAFLAVMKHRSLSAASRALGVAQPTVRRQIEALEAELAVVLFTRAPNGLVPTDVAHATLPYAEAMSSTARALVRSVSGATAAERGTVRVTASEVVGAEVLPPMLTELRASHPGIQIELVLSNRNDDLLRRDADVAVRMMRPTQGGLVARKLGVVEVGLYATAAYLAAHTTPRTPADLLSGHAIIGSDRDRGIIDALAAIGLRSSARDYTLRTDNHLAQVAAVRAGLGIGACQVGLAHTPVPLVRVLPKIAFPLEMWLAAHEDLRATWRVRTVFDHLATRLEQYATSPDRPRKKRG